MIEPDIINRLQPQDRLNSRAIYKFVCRQFSGHKVSQRVDEQTETYPVRTGLESARMAVLKNFDHPDDSSPPERFQNS
jgi:hypothetical protein